MRAFAPALAERLAEVTCSHFRGLSACWDCITGEALRGVADWLDDNDIEATAVGVANMLRRSSR